MVFFNSTVNEGKIHLDMHDLNNCIDVTLKIKKKLNRLKSSLKLSCTLHSPFFKGEYKKETL